RCKSDTATPGQLSAKLAGVVKQDHTLSLDVSGGNFTPPQMTPCAGGPPHTAPAAYTWPHFSQVFRALPRGDKDTYAFDHEWTNSAGGNTYTERYILKLEPVK